MKYKITILKRFIGIFLLALLQWSCAKDKGNYTYHDSNTLQISTDLTGTDPTVFITADSIDIRQNDSLHVKLKIEASLGTAKDFKYQWYVTQYAQSSANPAVFLIDSTASLSTKIRLVPNLYKLVAKVTDLNTSVSFYKTFALNVSGAEWGGEGWVILQDLDGGSDISVITSKDGKTQGKVFHDLYASVNGQKLPKGTFKVNVINYTTVLRAQKISFLYPNGGLEVRSIDFADSSKSDNWFLGASNQMNIQANGSAGSSGVGWEYLIINDQLAYRQLASAAHLKNPPKFFPPYEGLRVAPFVIQSASSDQIYTVFDKENKAFTLFNAATSVVSTLANYKEPIANLDPNTGQGFDMKNMGDNLIYAENAQVMNQTGNVYWNCFFRNNEKTKTHLIQFPRGLVYLNNFTTGRYQLTAENCPGINTATLFANPTCLPMPQGIFYYVHDHQIYTCAVNPLAGSTAQVGMSFAAGTVIKAMKVLNSGYTLANITALGVPEGKILVVATDESANGKGNNVYFFNINDKTGAIMGTAQSPLATYTGFGKITDIVFKKALGR